MKRSIKISRHASRRMQLYKISKNDIIELVNEKEKEILKGEKQSFVFKLDKYKYPLKIILLSDDIKIIIISVYPYKGKLK